MDQERKVGSRPSDKRRHGFESPEGMEMKDLPAAPKPRTAVSAGGMSGSQQQQQHREQPYPVPISMTASVSSQSPPPTDILASTTISTVESTPPSVRAAATLLLAEELATDSPPQQIARRVEETPTKPGKRRLFFTPSRRDAKKSPQPSAGRRQQAAAQSPGSQPSSQQYSQAITGRGQHQFQTPGSASSAMKTPGRRSSGRRQRRPPGSRSGLSGLSSTTPRSASHRTPSRRKFNPLGKISDIFSPQSPPSFSSTSPNRADGHSPGDSFGLAGVGENRSLVSAESSDASSVSTSNSVKEPFVEQVERLNELLATPSQQLGDLAHTPLNEFNSDDDLDEEMEDLEASRIMLAEELSKVDYSLLGGGGDDSSGIDWKGGTAASPQGDNSSDWRPLLTAEDHHPPNFSPIGQLRKKKVTASASTVDRPPRPKMMGKSALQTSSSSSNISPNISQDVTIYSGDEYYSPSMSSANATIHSGDEYFSPEKRSKDEELGETEATASTPAAQEIELDRKPAAKKSLKVKNTRTKIKKNVNYESLNTPPREREKQKNVPIEKEKREKKGSKREKTKYTPLNIRREDESATTTRSATLQGDGDHNEITFVPSQEEVKDLAPGRLMPNPSSFAQVEQEEDPRKNRRDRKVKPTTAIPAARKGIQVVSKHVDGSSSGESEKYTGQATTALKPRPRPLNIQGKGNLKAPPTTALSVKGKTEKEETETKKSCNSSVDQKSYAKRFGMKEVDPVHLTPITKHKEVELKEKQSEKSSPESNSSSTFDPFGFVARGESQLSSVDMGSGDSSRGSPTSSSTASRNDNPSIFQSFLSFAERFDDGGTPRGRKKSTYTPKRDVDHSRRVLEHLNTIFTPSGNENPNLSSITPERSTMPLISATESPDAAKESSREKKSESEEEEIFSTPPRDNDIGDDSIFGLSPISQNSEQIHLSTGDDLSREEAITALLSAKRPSNKSKVASKKTGSVAPAAAQARKSKDEKPPKINDPSTIVTILNDDGDDDIFYDPETPHANESDDVLTPLPGDKDHFVKFDKSQMPGSYDNEDEVTPTPAKGITPKSRCKRILLLMAIIVFVIGFALVLGTLFYPREETVPTPSPSAIISPAQQRTSAPSALHSESSLHPTKTSMPLNMDSPSLSPTNSGSEFPTALSINSFNIPYDVYITNGRVNRIPQSEYVPELIRSMDLLTDDILLNIKKRRSGGERRLTEVLLPTTITDVSDVPCPTDVTEDSLCQEVNAKISLLDAENTWEQFKDTMELAIEIGRLQYYLQMVDPNSPAEVIDAGWTPPVPTPAPTAKHSSAPLSSPLLNFLKEKSFDDGEALNDTESPQYRAYVWLHRNYELSKFSEKQKLQRFAMATLYYATNGDQWLLNDLWLSDRTICKWFNKKKSPCNTKGDLLHLELDLNNLGGSLPGELGLLSSLKTITLHGGPYSNIQGTLPMELGYLSQLKTLVLRNNDMDGAIPSEIGNCQNLGELDLSRNNFEGKLPSEIGNFADLTSFDISANFFSGSLPTEMGMMRNCRKMFFEYNHFASDIPTEIGYLKDLQAIRGGGNVLNFLPTELGELKSADIISFRDSSLMGAIPTELGWLRNLRRLELHNNSLSGSIPSELASIKSLHDQLDLSRNELSGPVPTELGWLSDLRVLKLHHNSLSGTVPSELSQMGKLISIEINGNDLSGTIPSDVCKTFDVTYPQFQADCDDFEDNCPCCTICCVGDTCKCRYLDTSRKYLCFQKRKGFV